MLPHSEENVLLRAPPVTTWLLVCLHLSAPVMKFSVQRTVAGRERRQFVKKLHAQS